MIDHDGQPPIFEAGDGILEEIHVHHELHVQPEIGHARRQRGETLQSQRAVTAAFGHVVKAQRPYAGIRHALQFGIADRVLHDRHRAQPPGFTGERVEQRGIIGAVRIALDDDAALDAEPGVHREQRFERRVGRRIRALRRKGKFRRRSEQVKMRVARAGRGGNAGLFGMRNGRGAR